MLWDTLGIPISFAKNRMNNGHAPLIVSLQAAPDAQQQEVVYS